MLDDVSALPISLGIEENLKHFLLVLAVALSVAALPQMLGQVRRLPYTLVLVLVGLALAFVDIRLVNLSPDLILLIFLPPLLFEASWNMRWKDLQRNLFLIVLLATIGIVIPIAGIALGLHQFGGLSLGIALLIGASLSATDPVSVTALFRELGVNVRLSTITEGESLFNDGMAVVAFGLFLGLQTGGTELSVPSVVLKLVTVLGIGIAVGCGIGFGISYLTQRFDLPLVEQSLTLVATYATYLVTEDLGGSGVIGVVTVGLILGNYGSRIGMNPRTRLSVSEFWEFLAFFINSILFLLVGDQVQFDELIENAGLIGITVVGMLVTRAIAIYLLCNASNWLNPDKLNAIPNAEQTVLWWGGVRGTVTIALALSLPATLPGRDQIIATVFGVVLFTLLVQGLSIGPLLRLLNLLGDQPLKQRYSELAARQSALTRVLAHLKADEHPDIEPDYYRYQAALIGGEIEQIQREIETLKNEHPNIRDYIREQLREELLAIEAKTYAELVQLGRLKQDLALMLEEVLPDSKDGKIRTES